MRKPAAAIGSAIFFMLAPVVIVGVVPWWITGWRVGRTWLPVAVLGVILVAAGTVVLLHAFARFVTEGGGTPAPVAPPTKLVVGGIYRFVRNPIYVALVVAIIGQALILGSLRLWIYAAGTWLVTAAFVRWYEEPILRAQFGDDYDEYRRAVPAWVPRTRPWRPQE
jgi:protein-S-isoprenylcysteine O-methyltransferase Ste14